MFLILVYLKFYFQFVLLLLRSLCHCVRFVIASPIRAKLSGLRNEESQLLIYYYTTFPRSSQLLTVTKVRVLVLIVCLKSYFHYVHLSLRSLCHFFPFVISNSLSLRTLCHCEELRGTWQSNLNCLFTIIPLSHVPRNSLTPTIHANLIKPNL